MSSSSSASRPTSSVSRRRAAAAPSCAPTTSQTSTGSAFPFAWMGSAALNANESMVARYVVRLDEDAVGRRGRLDPRCGVEHVAGSRPLSLARPRPEHHERLAGVDAGPDVEVEPLVLLVQLGDSLPDRERRADGALRIVLVGLRRAEQREDGVAAELLEGAAVGLELTADACVVRSHERLHVLGVEILGASGRADEVDEDRGDDLSLLAGRRRGGKRTPAEAAKPELCGIRFATRWADGGLRLGGLRLGSRERGAAEAANAELVGVLLAAAGADLHVFECTSRFGFAQSPGP